MKSFKVKMIALLVVVVMALTGCATMEVTTTVNSDGSAKATVQAMVSKEYVEGFCEAQGLKGQADVLWAEYKKQIQGTGAKAYNKTIDGKEYYVVEKSQKLRKGHLTEDFGMGEESYLSKDTVYFVFDSSDMLDDQTMDEFSNMADMKAIKCRFVIELPGKIVSTNGTIDKENDKKAVIEGNFGEPIIAFATSNKSMSLKKVKGIVAKANKAVKTKIKKVTPKKTSVKINYKKVKGHTYQIQYSKKKNFKNATIVNTKKTTYTIKKLKKGTKYYVRVRTTKKNMIGEAIYSKWVKKSIKTKKK